MDIPQQVVSRRTNTDQADVDQTRWEKPGLSNQHSATFYAFFYREGDILLRSKISYLGIFGMHVKADPMLLSKHTRLDVVIYLDTEHGPCQYKTSAVVTSHSQQGVGFTFVDGNADDLARLKTLVHYMYDNTNRHKAPVMVNYV